MEYDRSKLVYQDRPEQIWVVGAEGPASDAAYVSREAAQKNCSKLQVVEELTLHRPSLQPIYGGPTLLEALWSEMDALMERLMSGAVSEDGGDRFRAEELAWVLAIVTNAYAPSMDLIRKEAMDRWNAQQEFEAEQEAALNPEEEG